MHHHNFMVGLWVLGVWTVKLMLRHTLCQYTGAIMFHLTKGLKKKKGCYWCSLVWLSFIVLCSKHDSRWEEGTVWSDRKCSAGFFKLKCSSWWYQQPNRILRGLFITTGVSSSWKESYTSKSWTTRRGEGRILLHNTILCMCASSKQSLYFLRESLCHQTAVSKLPKHYRLTQWR